MFKAVVAQYEQFQQTPAIASNPANGVHNIPLQNIGGEAVAVSQQNNQTESVSSGINPELLLNVLDRVAKATPQEALHLQDNIDSLWNESTNPRIKQKLKSIVHAIPATLDPRRRTKDPSTGKLDPTASELARDLAGEIRKMIQEHKKSNITQAGTYNFAREAAKKKKKTRGNPFRVLMGQVGKLLDHGMDKKDIVRYLEKKSTFSKETIDRCVDVVRDYNRKKHRDTQPGPEAEQDIQERLSAMNTLRAVYADFFDYQKNAKVELSLQTNENTFNITRTAQTSRELFGVYAVQPDFTKRSTAELMARATWLSSLQGFNSKEPHSEGRNAASKQGAAEELKAIKSALIARGYDEQEIQFRG